MYKPKEPNSYVSVYDREETYSTDLKDIMQCFKSLKSRIELEYPYITVELQDVEVLRKEDMCELHFGKSVPNPNYKTQLEKYLLDMNEYVKTL
jgi:hypothetical protein